MNFLSVCLAIKTGDMSTAQELLKEPGAIYEGGKGLYEEEKLWFD
jgi:hypothetical protein